MGEKELTIEEFATVKSKLMRLDTGEVKAYEPLVAFLYLLARDYLPMGDIEEIMTEIMYSRGDEKVFTNGYLANWAKFTATRITGKPVGNENKLSLTQRLGLADEKGNPIPPPAPKKSKKTKK